MRLKRCNSSPGGCCPSAKRVAVDGADDTENDSFCWICHCDGDLVCCDTCPRVFHPKCAGCSKYLKPDDKWVCSLCKETQIALRNPPNVNLKELLLVILDRMHVEESEPFEKPVDMARVTNYREWVFNPIDLSLLRERILNGKYAVPQQFVHDAQWILHNCIIYNGDFSELTDTARAIVKLCKREVAELLLCPECYRLAIKRPASWFTRACSKLHKPVWAKLRGYPYWPGKVVNQTGDKFDVRFFGDYDRAKVLRSFVKNYHNPPPPQSSQPEAWVAACKEMDDYVGNLREAGCSDADLDIFPNRVKSHATERPTPKPVISIPITDAKRKTSAEKSQVDGNKDKAVAHNAKKAPSGRMVTRKMLAVSQEEFVKENVVSTTPVSNVNRFDIDKDVADGLTTQAYGSDCNENRVSGSVPVRETHVVILTGGNEKEGDQKPEEKDIENVPAETSSEKNEDVLAETASDTKNKEVLAETTSEKNKEVLAETEKGTLCPRKKNGLVPGLNGVINKTDDKFRRDSVSESVSSESVSSESVSSSVSSLDPPDTSLVEINFPTPVLVNGPLACSEETLSTGVNRVAMSLLNQMNGLAASIKSEVEASYESKLEASLMQQKEALVKENEEELRAAKRKHWCASCLKEATYYCCIHTTYCSLECQRQHWPMHIGECKQCPRKSFNS
eukprot:m.100340 g.100340  ORF g.100340 m.100340 type:complete len:676 (+) comp37088_c0_seq2:417-2444(+)